MNIDFTAITNNNASYLVILLYGIMTSFHCIGMCGGFVLSGNISLVKDKRKSLETGILYNVGRIISYTTVGAIAGGLGSIVVLSSFLKGALPFVAGIIMIIMGLNFLGVLKKIKINFSLKNKFGNKLFEDKSKNMFAVGLLSGFLPCGPMQAIQFYSLATASITRGALVMFVFAIGTVPILFLFGYFSSLLNAKFTKIVLKLSSIVLITMGLLMALRGLTLWGVNIDISKIWSQNDSAITATVKDDKQVLITEFTDEKFFHVAFKKGVPVKWIINVDKKYVGECVASVLIKEYGVEMELVEGENVIEFTPEEAKDVTYSSICGMISSVITIYE